MRRLGSKKGFTLVELSLSIIFIAILSITIVLIINDAISTYRRGITLNQINTGGMDLADDMRAAVQNSPAALPDCAKAYSNDPERENCNENNGLFLMTVEKIANIKLKGDKEIQNVPVYGAFCTGAYSYVWNSGYLFSDDVVDKGGVDVATLTYDDGESVGDFRLVKVRDNKREVCAESGVYDNAGITGEFTVGRTGEEPKVLLSASTGNALALYDLNVAIPALNDLGNAAFYSISFILGTVQGGINVMSSGNFCETPGSDSGLGNFDYCAINKFNFATQANGG